MLSHVIRAQSYDDSGKLATVGEYTIVRRKKVELVPARYSSVAA